MPVKDAFVLQPAGQDALALNRGARQCEVDNGRSDRARPVSQASGRYRQRGRPTVECQLRHGRVQRWTSGRNEYIAPMQVAMLMNRRVRQPCARAMSDSAPSKPTSNCNCCSAVLKACATCHRTLVASCQLRSLAVSRSVPPCERQMSA